MENLAAPNALRGKSYGVEHILSPISGPLVDILEKCLGLTSLQSQNLLGLGAIYLNQKRLQPCLENMQIEQGAYLRVHQQPRRFPVEQLRWPEALVYEDADLLVINKPSGLPVHPTVDNTQENLAALLGQKLKQEVFVTHRLDVGTSGLLIFAKHPEAQTWINKALEQKIIQKFYRALVHGKNLSLGEVEHFMQPSPRAPKTVSPGPQPGWVSCRLKILEQTEIFSKDNNSTSEVVIELLTGRTHQIRTQLSSLGFPIVGDTAYGSCVKLQNFEQICLQAFALSFPLLSGEIKNLRLLQAPWKTQEPT